MNTEAEKDSIRQAILAYYHEGHAKHDAQYYEPILHPAWKFFVLDGEGQLRVVERDEYFSWYDPKDYNPALDWKTDFCYIDVTGHLASVKIRIECQEVCYVDYFNMMKIGGSWWIVHKTSLPCPE